MDIGSMPKPSPVTAPSCQTTAIREQGEGDRGEA